MLRKAFCQRSLGRIIKLLEMGVRRSSLPVFWSLLGTCEWRSCWLFPAWYADVLHPQKDPSATPITQWDLCNANTWLALRRAPKSLGKRWAVNKHIPVQGGWGRHIRAQVRSSNSGSYARLSLVVNGPAAAIYLVIQRKADFVSHYKILPEQIHWQSKYRKLATKMTFTHEHWGRVQKNSEGGAKQWDFA